MPISCTGNRLDELVHLPHNFVCGGKAIHEIGRERRAASAGSEECTHHNPSVDVLTAGVGICEHALFELVIERCRHAKS